MPYRHRPLGRTPGHGRPGRAIRSERYRATDGIAMIRQTPPLSRLRSGSRVGAPEGAICFLVAQSQSSSLLEGRCFRADARPTFLLVHCVRRSARERRSRPEGRAPGWCESKKVGKRKHFSPTEQCWAFILKGIFRFAVRGESKNDGHPARRPLGLRKTESLAIKRLPAVFTVLGLLRSGFIDWIKVNPLADLAHLAP